MLCGQESSGGSQLHLLVPAKEDVSPRGPRKQTECPRPGDRRRPTRGAAEGESEVSLEVDVIE